MAGSTQMQRRQRPVLLVVELGALRVLQLRQGGVPEHRAVDEFHDEEGRADHVVVLAQLQHARHRHVGGLQALHDAILAVDRVRALQELARRLLAQHVAAAGRGEDEGRIRLAGRRLLGRRSGP